MRVLSPVVFTSSGAGRKEQLFLAAISAFCALTRPSRAEIAQIDDLTLSLLDHVSAAGKRFAAAAFSEAGHAPPGLVRRLCEESVEIAAPLLVRSPVLSDIALVGIIGRHGAGHARAIGRRPDVHPAIADLVRAILRDHTRGQTPDPLPRPDVGPPSQPAAQAPALAESAAETTRQKLRVMMALPAGAPGGSRESDTFARLRDTALDSYRPFFETALADATGLSLDAARRVAADGRDALPRALQALGLKCEQAFLIVAALHPGALIGLEAVRRFAAGFGQPVRASEALPFPRLKQA